jgi:hypothetical protein
MARPRQFEKDAVSAWFCPLVVSDLETGRLVPGSGRERESACHSVIMTDDRNEELGEQIVDPKTSTGMGRGEHTTRADDADIGPGPFRGVVVQANQ